MNMGFDIKTVQGRREYIDQTWDFTAALAYAGYKAYKRGAVVVAIGSDNPMYVPLAENNFGSPAVMQAIQDYDVDKEIVVLFFLGEAEPILERYSVESLPPPTAFEKYGKQSE